MSVWQRTVEERMQQEAASLFMVKEFTDVAFKNVRFFMGFHPICHVIKHHPAGMLLRI